MPDIDTDFDMRYGPRVFQHVIDKYGKERTANICTFMRMRMKQVIKDIARVFEIPYDEVNEFTKNIPETDEFGNPIEHIENLENLPGAKEFIEKYPKVIQFAKQLEDNPKALSQHPSGIGIAPFHITDLVPVAQSKPADKTEAPGYLAQAEMGNFEKAGLASTGHIYLITGKYYLI